MSRPRRPRPIPTADLIAEALRVIPDFDELEKDLDEEPERMIAHALERQRPSERPRAVVGAGAEGALGEPVRAAVERAAEAGRSAADKIKKKGKNAELTPEEIVGTEAIIMLYGRPAILIQNGRFFPPPKAWEKLESKRAAVETALQSVGRIEVEGHPSMDWLGTGFLVCPDVVMTNRHVAKELTRKEGRGWTFERGMKARIDFGEEFRTNAPEEFALTSVIGIHDEYDMALFRVEKRSRAGKLPPALPLAGTKTKAKRGQEVYVIGFPAYDSRSLIPEEMQRIFANIYNVKRLQPGTIRTIAKGDSLFGHDCSTLGGNSGSCVIDLETNHVLGLHFKGRWLETNWAVALWQLSRDALLKKAKVQFAA